MAIAPSPLAQLGTLGFDEFITQSGGDNRYELIDGEVFDLEPTGLHEQVAGLINTKACVRIDATGLPWIVLQRPLIRPVNMDMTAFRPDVAIIDETALADEPLWLEQSILTNGHSIKFVAEVVSRNWQNDYARKFEDYATLGIPKYWIADYAALGGIHYIGQPKQPTLSICSLEDNVYRVQRLQGDEPIVSLTFPNLNFTAAQVLRLK
ncbi:MAG: Uma2 family endonuclease [Synechococcales cyanobacterium CRU_2_2]|nr:Uma2 family endonuclease [Synechococcales cyanobacterium CRU_2_2]